MDKKPSVAKPRRTSYGPRYLLGGIYIFLSRGLLTLGKYLWRMMVFFAVMVLIFGTLGLIFGLYFYGSTVGELPKLEDPSKIALPQDSIIYDVDGKEIGVITSQRRYIVAGSEINQNMGEALVSIEDERFFTHPGVDFIGIARALVVDYNSWRSGKKAEVQGASTITQQYARLVYLNSDTTLQRKLKEVTLAAELESQLSKQDILTRYLNVVYFGNGNYGVEAASRYYFNKSAGDLNVVESALLAAVVNGPAIYDLSTDSGKAATFERAKLVLNKMYELGYIDRADLLAYKSEDFNSYLNITPPPARIAEPYYYDQVMRELLTLYPKETIYTGGWEIHTTLSIKKSSLMRKIVSGRIGTGSPTASMVDINPRTGAVNAFLGGMNYAKSNFNLATQGKRQPGSAFKPFVLATAFSQGMRYNSPASNAPLTLKLKNGKTWKIVPDSNARTLEQGIAYSDNAMFARLILRTGTKPVIDMAHRLGIVSDINNDPAIALGGLTYGVSALEMASAFSTFANDGMYNKPYSVETIKNNLGDTIYAHSLDTTRAINPEIAAMMNHSLQNVVKYGTAAGSVSLKNRLAIAGKTGTTNDHADTWFVGYTRSFAGAVWLGYPNARKTISSIRGQSAWGGTFTASIWNEYATEVLRGSSSESFPEPKGLSEVPMATPGSNLQDLEHRLAALGLTYNLKEIINQSYPENTVISVEKSGELVPLNSAITISIAVQKFTVPNFSGISPYDAIILAKDKFTVQFNFTLDDSIEASRSGTVFAQDTLPGSAVQRGTHILLTLKFRTPKPTVVTKNVPVPYVPKDSELYALQQQVAQLNNQVSTLNSQNTNLQSQLSNEKSRVRLLTPNFVGLDLDTAKSLAAELGFTVQTNGKGTVVSQSIPAGTIPAVSRILLSGTP